MGQKKDRGVVTLSRREFPGPDVARLLLPGLNPSPAHSFHCSSLRRYAPSVGVRPFTLSIAPPFGATHLRPECRRSVFQLLLPSALRAFGRSSAVQSSIASASPPLI